MSALRQNRILFGTDRIRIEFFAAEAPNGGIACVFVPGDTRSLEGNQHGGHFMVENGFDVVSFKTLADDWYQSVPESALRDIAAFFDEAGYKHRIAFGASMGGYAAMAFSKWLGLTVALGYSPQFTAKDGYDKRYAPHVKGLKWRYEINPEAISPSCDYFFVYDHKDFDRFHMARYRQIIAPGRYHELTLAYAGHPTTQFLHDLGLLKTVTLSVANDRAFPSGDLRAEKSRSVNYLRTLALVTAEKRKYATALALLSRQLRLDPASFNGVSRKTLALVTKGLEATAINRPPPVKGAGQVRRALAKLLRRT